MNVGERHHQPRDWAPDPAGAGDDGGAGLSEAREAAERFLQASDRALDRALSQDSEAFLRSSRQEGGQ
jgi:hypothetical protein